MALYISYESSPNQTITVYFKRTIVGWIKQVPGGFSYFPKKSPDNHGKVYPTLSQLQEALETY